MLAALLKNGLRPTPVGKRGFLRVTIIGKTNMSQLIDVIAELESLLPHLCGTTQGAAVEFAIKIIKEKSPSPCPKPRRQLKIRKDK